MYSSEQKINDDIKIKLSEHRYNHSVGVMEMAGELAKFYGLDIEKARLIGLAHDIAKQMTLSEVKEYISKYNINADELEKESIELIHSKIGADISKREYGFDEQMAKAIEYHTTGNPSMDMMAKIIFVADKIEKTRDYEGVEKRRKLAFEDIDKTIVDIIDYTVVDCIKRGRTIHPDSINTRNYLLKV